jgi:hypothetical protein
MVIVNGDANPTRLARRTRRVASERAAGLQPGVDILGTWGATGISRSCACVRVTAARSTAVGTITTGSSLGFI